MSFCFVKGVSNIHVSLIWFIRFVLLKSEIPVNVIIKLKILHQNQVLHLILLLVSCKMLWDLRSPRLTWYQPFKVYLKTVRQKSELLLQEKSKVELKFF